MRTLFQLTFACLIAALIGSTAVTAYQPEAETERPGWSELPTIDDLSEAELQDIADEAVSAMERGSYRSVRRNAGKLQDNDAFREAGLWLEARAEREGGDPRDIVELLDEHPDDVAASNRLRFEHGLAKLATGDYEGAKELGDAISSDLPDDPRGYWLSGDAEWQRGRYEDARALLQMGIDLGGRLRVAQGEEDFALAERLWASGWCGYRINALHVATARFNEALRAYQKHHLSAMGLARLYLETDKYASARQNFAEPTIEENPNLAEAYYWQARAFEYRWRSGDAMKALDRAIRANRDFVEGLIHRSLIYTRTDQYEKAADDLEDVLEINPKHIRGLASKALIAVTLGRSDQFDAIEDDVLEINPKPGQFYLTLGEGLAYRHRYDEAISFFQQGVEAQPDLWPLYAALGQAQLNSGDDENGRKNLQKALEEDTLRNSVVTRNLLLLLGTYEDRFERITEEDEVFGHTPIEGKNRFRLLIPKDELPIMGPYYMRELSRGMDRLTEKYLGYEPARPLTVEAFHVHADFEVRTIGLEGLPALGACFGKLITLDSPRARPFGSYNWASTLIHELDHVYQLQMSNGQCPRWLAEGCSVYEERRSRPEWERHMEDQLFQTYASNGLPKVKEFNEWFGDGSRVLFAYYLASIMVEFIVENYGGYGPIITMIKDFAAKKTPDQVFQQALKIDTEEFDDRFREYVGEKVGAIKLLPAVQVEELQDLQELAEDGEASLPQIVKLARAHYQQGNYSDARTWAGLASKRGIDSPELNYTLGFLALSDPLYQGEERRQRAFELLSKALNQGLEDFTVYMWMADFVEDGDAKVFYFNKARQAFPTNPAPLSGLFRFYLSENNMVMAQQLAEQFIMLSESDLQARQWLLDRYETLGNNEAAADMALQMIYVNPFNPIYHRARARALREMEDYGEAMFEWEMLRRTYAHGLFDAGAQQPNPNADIISLTGEIEALLEMAKTEQRRGDRTSMQRDLDDIRALDADNEQLQEFEQSLQGSDDDSEDEY